MVRKILPLWWAWQWRVIVAVFLAGLAIGLILGVAKALLGFSQETLNIISNILMLVVQIYASIYFLAYVLRLKYKKFRVVVLDRTDDLYRQAARK